jgi:hypothetical protein
MTTALIVSNALWMFMSFYLAIKYRELHLDYMKFIQDQIKHSEKTEKKLREIYEELMSLKEKP